MDLITAIKTCFKKYFVFKGRAKKSEYWWFFLFLILASFASQLLDVVVLGQSFWINYGPINTIVNLILIIPILSAGARRLHDTNRSGWWQLLILTIVGYIPLIIWLASEGKKKKNKFGK